MDKRRLLMKFQSKVLLVLLFTIVNAQNTLDPSHFVEVEPTGLPYNIIVESFSTNGISLSTDDKLGVFDDTLCVGLATVTQDLINGNNMNIVVWEGDANYGLPGFTAGNNIRFALLSDFFGINEVFEPAVDFTVGDSTFGYGTYSTVDLLLSVTDLPTLSLSNTEISFDPAVVGSSTSAMITFTNTGERTLEVTSLNIDNYVFSIILNIGFSIEPGGSISSEIYFYPQDDVIYNGNLDIYSNDPIGHHTISLNGLGIAQAAPTLDGYLSTLDLGEEAVGDTSTNYWVIQNNGNNVLELTNLWATSSEFQLPETNVDIQPGDIYSLPIRFAPWSKGLKSATIYFSHNDPDLYYSSFTISGVGYDNYFQPVSETGLAYNIIVESTDVDFDALQYGEQIGVFDDTLCVGIGVKGLSDQIHVIAWEKDDQYGLPGYTSGNTMTYKFWGNRFGEDIEATLTPTYELGNGTFGYNPMSIVELNGSSGLMPIISLSISELSFPATVSYDYSILPIPIHNSGTAGLNINSVYTNSNVFSIQSYTNLINADSSDTIWVQFSPNSVENYTGTLTIETNDPFNPVTTISLEGMGLPSLQSNVEILTSNVTFPPTIVGETSSAYVIIQNIGNATLYIDQVSTANPQINVVSAPSQFEPGSYNEINVVFSPTAKGEVVDEIQFNISNANNGYYHYVGVSGVGYDGFFDPVTPTGIPYNIVIDSVSNTLGNMNPGDEVAVYDNDVCVGVSVISEDYADVFPNLNITAWEKDDSHNLEGFTTNDSIKLFVYSSFDSAVANLHLTTPTFIVGNGLFGTGNFSSVALDVGEIIDASYFYGSITGIVVNNANVNETIENAQVSLIQDGETKSIDLSDSGGLFTIDSIRAGTYGLFIEKELYLSKTIPETLAVVVGDTITYDITLILANTAPVWMTYPDTSFFEDDTLTTYLWSWVYDSEQPDSLLNFTVYGNDKLSYNILDTPDRPLYIFAEPDSSGFEELISIIATDPYNLADTIDILIQVLPVNDAPVITSITSSAATEDEYFVYQTSGSDVDDIDINFTFINIPSWLTAESDSIYGVPLEGDLDTLFNIVASDGELSDTLTVNIFVTGVNDFPAINSPDSAFSVEDEYFIYHATGSDPEDSTLTWSFDNVPSWLTAEGDSIYGTPDERPDTLFTLYLSDGELQDTLTVALDVEIVNSHPEISLNELSGEYFNELQLALYIFDNDGDNVEHEIFYATGDTNQWFNASVNFINQSNDTLYYIWPTQLDFNGSFTNEVMLKISAADQHVENHYYSDIFSIDNHVGSIDFEFVSLEDELSGLIAVPYSISDTTGDFYTLSLEYLLLNSNEWLDASVVNSLINIGPDQYSDTLLWNTDYDLYNVDTNLVLRIELFDGWQFGSGAMENVQLDNESLPQLISKSHPDSSNLILTDELVFTFSAMLDVSTIINGISLDAIYGNYLINISHSYSEERSSIHIYPEGGWSGGDSLMVVINDQLMNIDGNPFDGNGNDDPDGEFDYDTLYYFLNHVGDYDYDGSINFDDLVSFQQIWFGDELQSSDELAPAVGTPPHLQVAPDNKFDFEDLMVFAQMWNWSAGFDYGGGYLLRTNNSTNEDLTLDISYPHVNNEQYQFNIELNISDFSDVGGMELVVQFDTADVMFNNIISHTDESWVKLIHENAEEGTLILNMADLNENVRNLTVNPIKLHFTGKKETQSTLEWQADIRNRDGDIKYSTSRIFKFSTTAPIPQEYALHQNYPNPFNPTTTIRYDLPEDAQVYLVIYNILGQEVTTLISEKQPAGFHRIIWDSKNQFGKPVSPGIYFYLLKTNHFSDSKKLVLLK